MMTLSYEEPMLAVLDNAHIPALSVSLNKHNNVTHFEGGITDTSNPQPVNASTLFSASSLSKPVSAAIVLDLAQQNSWDLNTPLSDMGDYGTVDIQNDDNYHKLTIGMVLGQCSGLPNWLDENTKTFITTPGERFGYSGVAFDYLKEVIEKNSKINKSWEELAQEFFIQTKMKNSTFKQCEVSHLSGRMVARGHQGDGTPEPIAPVNSPEVPAASLLTTAEDYMLFLQYCYADPFLRSTFLSTHSMVNDEKYPSLPEGTGKITWGLGMGIYQDHKQEIAFHWGNNPGSDTFCALNLATGDAVACFSNSENGPNVFPMIVKEVVGDMQPVFELLSDACSFRSTIKAESPEVLREQLSTIMNLPQAVKEQPMTSRCHGALFLVPSTQNRTSLGLQSREHKVETQEMK